MKRREFLATSCVASLTTLACGAAESEPGIPQLPGESNAAYRTRLARIRAAQAAQATGASEGVAPPRFPGESEAAYRARVARARAGGRLYYELRRYEIETEQQKAGFDRFAKEAAIPALNRLGIEPVGVFYPEEGLSPIYVLLPHRSLGSFAMLTESLAADEEFSQAGAAFLDATAANPAYKSMQVQLMRAFEGMPTLDRPIEAPDRIFQLRIYESPSVKAGLKKIEMFNTAELGIFRRVGLHPVFFGETLAGTNMPNLTYMLVFKDQEERKANWKTFSGDPEWQQLRARPEYLDKEIIRNKGITNLFLKPAEYSQI